jgi:hypothetical protein
MPRLQGYFTCRETAEWIVLILLSFFAGSYAEHNVVPGCNAPVA